MTPAVVPTASTWVLRFKHNRTTLFLHCDPLQKLSSIRAELLKAIQQTSPDGKLNGHAIPDHASDILLARPVDINDLTLGWEAIDTGHSEDGMLEDKKGKGKATASAGRGKLSKDAGTDCPQGVGLKDGGVVAFRFRLDADASNLNMDEGIDIEEDEKLVSGMLAGESMAEKWDVVVPTMEETYGDDEMAEAAETDVMGTGGKNASGRGER
ncbi:hypothetical protein BAUCODRAFT_336769 [Baudoinia panamericana UAMH 10762]|uniref:Uncharacterized protein n=1 Tax=Baudoinia panamericana (strain UAMH 10762) TaxID=717646 RepID=M2NJ64_BAUPA|nr:uncharacterized protein BAUCODRAFT_336769 [Baudoinia panamericana UAMH 10762]EMC99434.1 hypothetical protein BAUCODRAFT_336769 [Baudoinia panamericana UAMH 10762]